MRSVSRPPVPRTIFLAPLLIGFASALAQFSVQRPQLDFFYWQGPFFYAALAGMAVAFACRPPLSKIPWTRGSAIGLALALLAGLGDLGDWGAAILFSAMGLSGFPVTLPPSGLALAAGVLVAGVLMGWLYRPAGGQITGRELWARFRFFGWNRNLTRLAGLGLFALCVWLVLGWLDALLEESRTTVYFHPLLEPIEPNYWLRMAGIWQRETPPSGWAGSALMLGVLWLRALILFIPLVPIALVVRGSRTQLTLVFLILLFVLREFAPLMRDPSFYSLVWLLARIGMGLLRSFLLAAAMVALFGLIRSGGEAPSPLSTEEPA